MARYLSIASHTPEGIMRVPGHGALRGASEPEGNVIQLLQTAGGPATV
jgi:hypothetical protein